MSRRKARRARLRAGRVSVYSHHGAWWLCYRSGGQRIRRKVALTCEDAERVAAQVNAQLASGVPTLLAFSVPELRRQFLNYRSVRNSASCDARRLRGKGVQFTAQGLAAGAAPPATLEKAWQCSVVADGFR